MACKYKSRVWDNGWCNVACRYCTLTQESDCEHNKQTNADRIRAMSDEELAKEMRSHAFALAACSERAWLEWLKQPAK